MKKTVIAAFLIGTAMPFFWLWLALAMFNPKGLDWLDYPMMITSPVW